MDALLKVWPGVLKETYFCGRMPLHAYCWGRGASEVVAALLKAWPEAVKEKSIFGKILLHLACSNKAPFEVTTLLLKTWLSYKENRTKSAIMSFQRDSFNFAGDVKVLLSHLFALCSNNADNPSPNEIMDYFVHIKMWNGVMLNVDRNPAVIKTIGLDTKAMVDLLSTVGQCCTLTTMWEVICHEQDLLEGV
eukprot:8090840-Ditylum_brightwellii.AAC.1